MKQVNNVTPWKRASLQLIPFVFFLFIFFTFQPLAFAEEHEHGHDHEQQGEHNGHDEHEEDALKFSSSELQEFNIKLAQAHAGVINKTLDLTGEVIVAPERLYHVVPRVAGVVREVYKYLGDHVKANDLLAVLSSRDLADAKAQFVAADSLLKLANSNLQRETKLYKEKITAKRNYFIAKQAQAEMSIKRKAAKQRLLALGLSENSIRTLLQSKDKDLTLYELRAPAEGVIIEKHAVRGEVLATNTRSFTLADLSQVWVNLTVYQKDLARIQRGQSVLISNRFDSSEQNVATQGVISWISPTLDEQTRSAIVRVVIDNPEGHWRPGMFVSAKVAIEQAEAEIVIPLSALQTMDGQTVVFVQHDDGDFEPQSVQTGRRDFKQVEIIQGLKVGQSYVSQNAFSLKAQMQKGEFGEGHSH
jgi:cobalt-zinc-cadmium efflux system membrane fusion protein